MFEIRQTQTFERWRTRLKDPKVRAVLAARLARLAGGLIGDAKSIGDGVSELRIHTGPGYRVYFHRYGSTIILLLCGGDKSTQTSDIRTAKRLLKDEGQWLKS